MCLRQSSGSIRPSAIISVALQCPSGVLDNNTERLRFQAQEIVDWFFGAPDPDWLPEHLLYEEVEEIIEEVIEEYALDNGEDEEEDDEKEDEDEEPQESFRQSPSEHSGPSHPGDGFSQV